MRAGGSSVTLLSLAAVLAVAFCLIPAGAHFFELPNKMALPADQYMVVQRIYAGWAFFGIPIFAALILTAWHAVAVRNVRSALLWSVVAFMCIVAAQVIFWTFTYPMNVLTANWTVTPTDLESARRQWEYSHAVNAVLTLIAILSITWAALVYARASELRWAENQLG
jgi:hypothetical protein